MASYLSRTERSRVIHERAKSVIPGGVTYSIRDYDPYPFYAAKGEGSQLTDIDGNVYTDYWCGHFSLILGHVHPSVASAVREQLDKGWHLGVCHELEVMHAEQVIRMIPSAEMVKFTNSGTEANMYAIRLARAFTKRNKIAKFEGGWHGGYDAIHVAVKPPFEKTSTGGLTDGSTGDTMILPYNDLEGVRKIIKGVDLAAILIDPVVGGAGFIPAEKEFLKGLRELCDEKGAVLIFDEVITGFRLARGGAQEVLGVYPDLTVLGKIVGGGFPVGAVVGRGELMERYDHRSFSPPDLSFLGGTYVGNPITMVAGLTTLKIIDGGTVHYNINRLGEKARRDLQDVFDRRGLGQVTGLGSLFGIHFTKEKVTDPRKAATSDQALTEKYHRYLLEEGIFALSPRNLHLAVSNAHSKEEVEKMVSTTEQFLKSV